MLQFRQFVGKSSESRELVQKKAAGDYRGPPARLTCISVEEIQLAITPIVLPYFISYITFFKELGLKFM